MSDTTTAPVAVADVRTRAVQAFHDAATAVLTAGDRPMSERLEQIARNLSHHDTTDAALTGLMQAFATPTEEPRTDA